MLTVLRSPGPDEFYPGYPKYLQGSLQSQCQKALKSNGEEERYESNTWKYCPVFQEKKGQGGEEKR